MDSREDHDLVAACRNERRDAYGILVQRHWQRVLGVCLAVLGNPDDTEDAAQEAMLKGLEQIGKLRDAQQFGPWIVRIARNLSIDVCRKQKRRRDHLRQQHPPSPAKASDHHDLETAIGALPLELRIPLVMYYFDGRSAKNISNTLEVSHATLCQRLRCARQELHRLLTEHGDGP